MKSHQFKILLVDDEPDILEFLTYNLQKEGYLISTAPDGLAGLELAKTLQPDLVLLDIMMPVMDGIETCRELRKIPIFADLIIVFLTAREEDYLQIDALNMGGDDYITKPIKPRVLVSRIQALFRRLQRQQEQEDIEESNLVFPQLSINKETRVVNIAGEDVVFARKEFEILWYLASKPGKVFTRDEIYEAVWGNDVIVGNRTIDVHIRKLRERLGDQYIKTFKGIGYKFEF
jgi:two-component system, OmpR family, alkaline phosphatase synthesis response regulator PhoP